MIITGWDQKKKVRSWGASSVFTVLALLTCRSCVPGNIAWSHGRMAKEDCPRMVVDFTCDGDGRVLKGSEGGKSRGVEGVRLAGS